MKVGDKVFWGEQVAEISELLESSAFKYRIEWRNPYGEYRTRCVNDCEIVLISDATAAPQLSTPVDIPAPILAAYHKWLVGGFDPVFIARAIEAWLKEQGQ